MSGIPKCNGQSGDARTNQPRMYILQLVDLLVITMCGLSGGHLYHHRIWDTATPRDPFLVRVHVS